MSPAEPLSKKSVSISLSYRGKNGLNFAIVPRFLILTSRFNAIKAPTFALTLGRFQRQKTANGIRAKKSNGEL